MGNNATDTILIKKLTTGYYVEHRSIYRNHLDEEKWITSLSGYSNLNDLLEGLRPLLGKMALRCKIVFDPPNDGQM